MHTPANPLCSERFDVPMLVHVYEQGHRRLSSYHVALQSLAAYFAIPAARVQPYTPTYLYYSYCGHKPLNRKCNIGFPFFRFLFFLMHFGFPFLCFPSTGSRQPRPTQRGGAPALPNFGGCPLCMTTLFEEK